MISLSNHVGIFECYCYKYPRVSSFQKFKGSSAILYLIHIHHQRFLQQHESTFNWNWFVNPSCAMCNSTNVAAKTMSSETSCCSSSSSWSSKSQSAMNSSQPFAAVSCPTQKSLSSRFVAHFTSRGHCVILRSKNKTKRTNVLHMVVSKSSLRIRMMHIEGLPPTVRMPCHRIWPMRSFESMGSHGWKKTIAPNHKISF